jgi:hypothetical protein
VQFGSDIACLSFGFRDLSCGAGREASRRPKKSEAALQAEKIRPFALRPSPARVKEFEAWAAERGITRSEAVRQLMELGWNRRLRDLVQIGVKAALAMHGRTLDALQQDVRQLRSEMAAMREEAATMRGEMGVMRGEMAASARKRWRGIMTCWPLSGRWAAAVHLPRNLKGRASIRKPGHGAGLFIPMVRG